MDQPHRLEPPEKRDEVPEDTHVRAHVRAGSVEREGGEDHDQIDQEDERVGGPRERVVADETRGLAELEEIETERLDEAAAPAPLDRDELVPAGEVIAAEHPDQARKDRERKQDGCIGVDDLHRSRQEVVPGGPGDRDGRVANVDARHREDGDGKHDPPVGDPEGPFPDVDPHEVAVLRRMRVDRELVSAFRDEGGEGRAHTALTFASRFLLASTTWPPQAMQGSKEWMVRRISIGLVGSATGVFRRASSYGPRLPWASLGPAFHVLGTTHW